MELVDLADQVIIALVVAVALGIATKGYNFIHDKLVKKIRKSKETDSTFV